jgi:transposase-like protein
MNLSDNHLGTLFKHCHFDSSIIIVCIPWCITSKLSYRDLVAIMADRNMDVAHPTILRWV